MATTPPPKGTGDITDSQALVEEIMEQRKASLRYMQNNYYDEWTEIYRNLKARVEKKMRKNDKGEDVEDTSRTNVCMPDHHVMLRHGVARLTRNGPNLRLRGEDPVAADKLAMQLMYQWDRSETQRSFRQITRNAKAFGWGVGKNYYDKIVVTRDFRKLTNSLSMADLLKLQGAPDDEVDDAQASGAMPDEMQLTRAIAQHGNSVPVPTDVTKYEGPLCSYVFSGDIFLEPGFRSLNESAYRIENNIRDEQWLEYWVNQTTEDPDTGEEMPVLDAKQAQKLLNMAGDRNYVDEKSISLRRQMREAIAIADPRTAGKPLRPPRKRFMVDERESIVDGRLCIDYVGEESIYLGRLWFPWNTYGKSTYTEMVLIPDLIEGIGDSTLRISRFLMQLRNARANQTTDFINNKLLPLMKKLRNSDITDDDLIRTAFARVLQVKSMGDVEMMQDPLFPEEAWQDQAGFIREMQQVEPAMNDFQPGTEAVPQSGRLATIAILQKQGADAVLADELNNMGQFVRDTAEIWIYFNQQAMEEKLQIPADQARGFKKERIEALSIRHQGGDARTIEIDPMDIQQEFEVLPEEGSTLASDDQYKTAKLQEGLQLAMAAPQVFNVRTFAAAYLKSMPGISPEEGLAPPPQPPPPQPPQIRVNVSVAVKFDDLAADAQEALLQGAGLPSQGTVAMKTIQHTADTVEHVGRAADAAAKLQEPAVKLPTPAGMKGQTGDNGQD